MLDGYLDDRHQGSSHDTSAAGIATHRDKWRVLDVEPLSDAPVNARPRAGLFDFVPTLLEMAGLPPMPEQHVDGVSLMPLLTKSGDLKPRPLFWHFPNYIGATHVEPARPQSVVRDGAWKLMEFLEDGRLELYNLRNDLGERNNLAAQMPDKAKELHQKLFTWRKSTNVQMPRLNPEYAVNSNKRTDK
jgi:arylsulfatase A-like enzyme